MMVGPDWLPDACCVIFCAPCLVGVTPQAYRNPASPSVAASRSWGRGHPGRPGVMKRPGWPRPQDTLHRRQQPIDGVRRALSRADFDHAVVDPGLELRLRVRGRAVLDAAVSEVEARL